MGKIRKISENELVGGTQDNDIYPVTSVKAIYDENNTRLDDILNKLNKDNEESLKLLSGISDNSNGREFPFKSLGNVSTIEDINDILDNLHSTIFSDNKSGAFRLFFENDPIFIENIATYYAEDKWTQSVRGRLKINSTNNNKVALSDSYNILTRTHDSIGWGKWVNINDNSIIKGIITLGNSENVKKYQEKLTSTGDIVICIIGDNNGKLPSSTKAITVPSNVHKELICSSPNTTINNILRLIPDNNFEEFGVNVGDAIILTRVIISVEDLCDALKLTEIIKSALLAIATEIEIYQYKIICTNDAKPLGNNEVAKGASGIVTPWDKTQINKIPYLESLISSISGSEFPTREGNNMNDNVESGIYPWCTLGRPTGSTGAYTLISFKTTNTDSNNLYTTYQIAFGRQGESNRIFSRLIFHNSESKEILDWVELSNSTSTSNYLGEFGNDEFNDRLDNVYSDTSNPKLGTYTARVHGLAPYLDRVSEITIKIKKIEGTDTILQIIEGFCSQDSDRIVSCTDNYSVVYRYIYSNGYKSDYKSSVAFE